MTGQAVPFLPAQCNAIAGASYGPVSVSVNLSVRHKPVFCRNGWTERARFWQRCFVRPILYCTLTKRRYLQKYVHFPLELCLKLGTSIISPRHIDRQSVLSSLARMGLRRSPLGPRGSIRLRGLCLVGSNPVWSGLCPRSGICHFVDSISELRQSTATQASAGFWLGGSMPPCRLRRR